VSGAGSEWGGGVRADLALGRRREEARAHSFFFSAWCAVGRRRTRRSGAGGRTHRAREENTGRPLNTQPSEIKSVHVQMTLLNQECAPAIRVDTFKLKVSVHHILILLDY
jgi:hypothetical protein